MALAARRVNCPESQLGFFNVFVLPLLNAFVKVFPECSPLLDQVGAHAGEFCFIFICPLYSRALAHTMLPPCISAVSGPTPTCELRPRLPPIMSM